MGEVSVIFSKVFEKPENYLSQRVALLNQAGLSGLGDGVPKTSLAQLRKYVEALLESLKEEVRPPLSAPVDFSKIDKRLGMRRDCMIAEINQLFPQNDGENTEKDTVHYLNDDWFSYPKHAVVLKRVTNLSESLYIYPGIKTNPENDYRIEEELVAEDAMVAASIAFSIDFGGAAKTLADGLAGLLPPPLNVLGATLISAFWPSAGDATAQWQQVYDALQTIVRNGLAQNNVNIASAKLQGFMTFLDTEYKSLKETPTVTKQQLLDALVPYDTAFFLDIVNIFMFTSTTDQAIAAASLANFMTGACLHMGLNQERALEDPSVPNPSDSAYAKTVSKLATVYGDYAKKTAPYVKQLRLAQISGVQDRRETFCHGGAGGGCTTIYTFWFTDGNNGYRSPDFSYNSAEKNPPDARGDAQAALNSYTAGVSGQMDVTLQSQVYNVVDSWSKLVGNPVPRI